MEKRDLEILKSHYYGFSKSKMIWIEDLETLDNSNNIRRIYEIVDKKYDEIWYMIKDKEYKTYIMKSKRNNEYSSLLVKPYKEKYDIFQIDAKVIEMYDRGIFPIIYKVSKGKFNEYYNKILKNRNPFLNSFYCYDDEYNKFKAVKIYRNKHEYETFREEIDAVRWCNNLNGENSNLETLYDSVFNDT